MGSDSNAQKACKPDSVREFPPWMTIPLAPPLPAGSSCQPGPLGLKRPCGGIGCPTCPARGPYSALLRVGLAVPSRLPGPRWALTPPFHPYPACRAVSFSVALSLGLPPPGVTRHPCFMESGLSSHPAVSLRTSPNTRSSSLPRKRFLRGADAGVNGSGAVAQPMLHRDRGLRASSLSHDPRWNAGNG